LTRDLLERESIYKQAVKTPNGGTWFRLMVLFLGLSLIGAVLFLGCERASELSPPPQEVHKKKGHKARSSGKTGSSPSEPDSPAFQAVDRILDKLEFGNIAFNVPSSMNLQDTETIQLILSLNKPIDELRQLIEAQGEKEGARIRVSNQMEARLTGLNFKITAITPEKQAITEKELTKWEWEIKPEKTGHSYLHLTLTAILTVEGISTARAIRTFDKTIDVNVTWRQKTAGFLLQNWQWLWAAIIIPIAGWLWRRRKK
jgi:hypothetical protein